MSPKYRVPHHPPWNRRFPPAGWGLNTLTDTVEVHEDYITSMILWKHGCILSSVHPLPAWDVLLTVAVALKMAEAYTSPSPCRVCWNCRHSRGNQVFQRESKCCSLLDKKAPSAFNVTFGLTELSSTVISACSCSDRHRMKVVWLLRWAGRKREVHLWSEFSKVEDYIFY